MFAITARRVLASEIANVHCQDSIQAVQSRERPRDDYNFVLLEHGVGQIIGDNYCEHFDLFPQLFDPLGQETVIIANMNRTRVRPQDFDPRYLERRKDYFGVTTDAETLYPSFEILDKTYRSLIPEKWRLRDIFFVPHPFRHPTEMVSVVLVAHRV